MRKRPEERYEDMESFSPWEVYSDLYCGLLLVFVLLFFFAIYQYISARETNDADTKQLQTSMKEEQEAVLALYKADLEDQEAAYREKSEALESRDAELSILQAELEEKESELSATALVMNEKESELAASGKRIETQERILARNREQLKEKTDTLAEKESELEEQRTLLASREEELKEQRTLLAQKETELDEKDSELSTLQATISEQEELLRAQQQALEEQAVQLEQIVGVRSELIGELSGRLNDNGILAQVDPDTGAIAFESEILFELNSNELKEEGKEFFRTFIPVYMSVLLQPEFENYIAEIMIEGHTDNAGSYLHNLELSQQRAYSVAEYILSDGEAVLDEETRGRLKSMITVNGCADRSPVLNADGSINADKSRRVEIKFSLMDQEMIQEMNRILNMDGTEDS